MASKICGRASRVCWRRIATQYVSPFDYTLTVRRTLTASTPAAKSSRPAPKVNPEPKRESFTLSVAMINELIEIVGKGHWNRPAEEYFNCATAFDSALQGGMGPDGAGTKELSGYSPQVMHETACLLRLKLHPIPQASARRLWASAAALGHQAAALTLVRDLVFAGKLHRIPNYARLERQFKALVVAGRDPNALTVEGEHLFLQKKYLMAMHVLEKALQLNAPSFGWKINCQLCLARTYLALGKTDEAVSMLEELSALGLPEANQELGILLQSSDPARAEDLILKAACRGKPQLFSYLAEMALERASEAEDAASREEHQRWAMEWSKLADERVQF